MLPPTPRIQTYKEFWPFYLKQHSKRETRLWHAAGTSLGIALAGTMWVSGHARWMWLALVPAYALAWYSHFYVEHNRPATFQYPIWSFVSDFRMLAWMLLGKL